MTRYSKMTEAELDSLLVLSFHPKKKEKLNLSNREIFIYLILEKIEEAKLLTEFGENVLSFIPMPIDKTDIGLLIYRIFIADIRIYKMAALKTFDEYKEYIK